MTALLTLLAGFVVSLNAKPKYLLIETIKKDAHINGDDPIGQEHIKKSCLKLEGYEWEHRTEQEPKHESKHKPEHPSKHQYKNEHKHTSKHEPKQEFKYKPEYKPKHKHEHKPENESKHKPEHESEHNSQSTIVGTVKPPVGAFCQKPCYCQKICIKKVILGMP